MKPSRPTLPQQDVRKFRGSLRLLVRKLGRQFRDETGGCGLGYLAAHILLELDGNAGRSLRDLEAVLEIDKAALSRSVDALVKEGLVSREPNPEDRRAVLIGLTDAGKKKVAEIHRYSDEKYRELFRLIPAREHATVLCAVDYLARAIDDLCGETGYCAPTEKKKDA
ncbi:hypothetical protein DB347_14070 [Opitutaceae bacterium EW11]|nr:hypothetical protein DB347_14070 [Opitutaceae bacterium EW11]